MKKLFSVVLAAVLLCALFAGCGGNAPASSADSQTAADSSVAESAQEAAPESAPSEASAPAGEIELDMYHSWSSDTERGAALEASVNAFNEANAGTYKIVLTVNPDFPAYQEKVKAMISANETPDIFHYNFNPNDLSRQNSGKLMDFLPHMDDEWKSRFYDADLELLTVNGQLTSIPYEKAGALIYANPELLSAAGIDVESFPASWDELFAAFDAIDATGAKAISLFTSDDAWHTTNLLTYLWAATAGNSAANGSEINTPEMVKAAEYLRRAFNYTTSDAVGANYSVSMNNFATGNTALVIDGPWLIGMLPPEVAEKTVIVPAPTFGDGKITAGYTVTDSQTPWAAGAQTDPAKEEAIVAFMKHITSEEAAKKMTLEGSVFLSLRLELGEEEISSLTPLLANYIRVFTAAQESAVNMQRNLTTAANSALPSLVESLVLDQMTPQEFVEQLDLQNQ